MDHHPLDRARARTAPAGGERPRPGAALALRAAGLCILALECSQVLYHTAARPDATADLSRDLIAVADEPGRADRPTPA
jgi:hypothetical protein